MCQGEVMDRSAVVFDLFHTLIDTEHLRPPGFDAIVTIAEMCSVEHGPLRQFWDATYLERETTTIDLVELFERYCASIEIGLSPARRSEIDRVFGVCKDDALRHPEPDMVALVAAVASLVPVGVLSNCHEREVRCWDESPFAPLVSSFGRSTRIGAMKPEPATYRWVIDALAIDSAKAVYVGNGSSDELLGARNAGFGTVVHCNIFDRMNGLVSATEQRRRADQADESIDTIAELDTTLRNLVAEGRSDRW